MGYRPLRHLLYRYTQPGWRLHCPAADDYPESAIEAWHGRRWGRSMSTMSKGDVWSLCTFVYHSVQINVFKVRHDSENRRKNGKSHSRFFLGPQKKSEKKSCGSYACARCAEYEWLECGGIVRAWGRNMVISGSEGVLQGLDNGRGSRVNGNLSHFRNRKQRRGTRVQCELCNRENVKQYLNHMRVYQLSITNRSVCAPFLTQVNTSSRLRSIYSCPVPHAREIFLSPYCIHNAIHTALLVSNMNTIEKKMLCLVVESVRDSPMLQHACTLMQRCRKTH
jgi:hypothetical protein